MVIFRPIGKVWQNHFRSLPIFSCPLCCANTRKYLAYRQSVPKKMQIFVDGTANAPRVTCRRGECAAF
jgi:hypothetical protein